MTQRIALVTGGGRGLGKNAALKLASKGIGIILTWNSNEKKRSRLWMKYANLAVKRRHYR